MMTTTTRNVVVTTGKNGFPFFPVVRTTFLSLGLALYAVGGYLINSITVINSGRLSESRAYCQKVEETVRKSRRLSESRGDCQKVEQTVRESSRLSESRADCHSVRESSRLSESRADCHSVRESSRLSESRADCQKVSNIVREAATSSWKWRRRHGSGDVVMEAATSSHYHDNVVVREMATSTP